MIQVDLLLNAAVFCDDHSRLIPNEMPPYIQPCEEEIERVPIDCFASHKIPIRSKSKEKGPEISYISNLNYIDDQNNVSEKKLSQKKKNYSISNKRSMISNRKLSSKKDKDYYE